MNIIVNYHLIAAIFIFFILFIVYINSNRKVNVAFYVISIYFFSVLGGILLDPTLTPASEYYSLGATATFLLLMMFYFIPIACTRTHNISSVECLNYKFFNLICCVFILVGVLSYLHFVPIIIDMLSYISDLKNFRGRESVLEANFIYLFLTLGCQFFPIVLLFYFHSITYQPEKIWFNRILLFSSTAYIVNVLTVMGRDGFVLWTMSYVFAFLLYRNILPTYIKKRIRWSLISLLSLFSIVFFTISISRFGDDGLYWLVQKLLLYFSQQFGEFNRFYVVVNNPNLDVGAMFPFIDLFGTPPDRESFIAQHYRFLSEYGFSKNVFKTFLGHFYENMGFFVLFFVSFLYFFIFTPVACLGDKRRVNFGKLVIITMFCQIVLHGVFYYKLSYMVSNIYLICCCLIALGFSYRFKC
ncbi:hypothetical protein SOPP22_08695 [Shewanella sp. OPT22]|nr:hypothetical protein SOPP22_08695 [Shewanella sp. OPT22]